MYKIEVEGQLKKDCIIRVTKIKSDILYAHVIDSTSKVRLGPKFKEKPEKEKLKIKRKP